MYLLWCGPKQVVREAVVREHGSAKVIVGGGPGRWEDEDAAELGRKRLPKDGVLQRLYSDVV